MSSTTPEMLLKGALERIVYFEARSQQLAHDVERANGLASRLQAEVMAAAQREIDLRRQLAELEVRLARATAEREEAARLTEALRRERTELVSKMLDANRLEGAEGLDLAQFIAQLRSEVLGQAHSPEAPVARPAGTPASPAVAFAADLRAHGRLEVSSAEVEALAGPRLSDGRVEQTLFGFSVRELSAADGAVRARAAERLKALGQKAAAPALATALHAESHRPALVAMLAALGALAGPEATPVVQPLLSSASGEVRIAALKALLALDPVGAAPFLAAAASDPEPAVRRRASLLALSLPRDQAAALGTTAIRDEVAQVRALGALVLAASRAEAARPLLLAALRDEDAQVRRAAGRALSALLGHDVTPVVGLDAHTRAREVRRLAGVPAVPLQARAAPVPRRRQAPVAWAFEAVPAPRAQVLELTVAPTTTALGPAVLAELRAALRGRTPEELASALAATPTQAVRTLSHLLDAGAVVRRGQKYFVA
jgi:HEAT repeat protein